MAKITFSKVHRSWGGDQYVDVSIDGQYAVEMKKAYDGEEWYTYGDEHPDIPDADHGRTLQTAKRSLKCHITESIKNREQGE